MRMINNDYTSMINWDKLYKIQQLTVIKLIVYRTDFSVFLF